MKTPKVKLNLISNHFPDRAKLLPVIFLSLMIQACAHQPLPEPYVKPQLDVVPYIVHEPPGIGRDEIWQHLPRQKAEVVIAAAGDVLMHGRVKKSAEQNQIFDNEGNSLNNKGYNFLFEFLKPLFEEATLAVVNLETPVAPVHGTEGKPFVFNAPPDLLDGLIWAGIDMVTVANNHAYDQGSAALTETIERASQHGLITIGAGRTATEAETMVVKNIDSISIGFLACTQLLNSDLNSDNPENPRINFLEREKILSTIESAKQKVDFLILVVHWGVEYSQEPRKQEIDLAHECLEAGADAIVGHHPHVLQPIEIYPAKDGRLCLIAYSLGNLISNQSRNYNHSITPPDIGETRDGAVLKFRIARIEYDQGIERVELRGVGYIPLFTENYNQTETNGTEPVTVIQPVPNDFRIRQLIDRIKTLSATTSTETAPDPATTAEIIRLKKELALYADRKQAIQDVLGADFCLSYVPK